MNSKEPMRVTQEEERKGVLGANSLLYLYGFCVPLGIQLLP